MHVFVDADMVIFKAGMAGESRTYFVHNNDGEVVHVEAYKKDAVAWSLANGGEHTFELHREAGPLSHTLSNAKSVMKRATAFATDGIEVYIGGKGNFRYGIYPEYKANRKDGARPIQEEEIRQYLIKNWHAVVVDNEECDDVVSYLQCASDKGTTYIASCDKDLRNTPGWAYNWDKDTELVWISDEDANLNFARQLLTGDSTDNIPGLRGVGNKGALKILPRYRSDWLDVVKTEYERVWGWEWEEQINLNGSLLWMRRKPNEIWTHEYNYETK